MARDYSADVRRKKRLERRVKQYVQIAGCVAAILLVSFVITKIIDGGKDPETNDIQEEQIGVLSEVLAPLPMQDTGDNGMMRADFGPVKQDENSTVLPWNMQTMRLQQRGQVSLDYFSDSAFLGDSITTGFMDYKVNLSGALICAYRGIGPDSVVKRSELNHAERGAEIPLNTLASKKPKKLYVMLGSNSLTVQGNDEAFLAYYGQMLDELKKVIAPGGIIYVQSVPPVQAKVTEAKPGLEKNRIQAINERLAALAMEKGCAYIDLWEVLADEEGNLRADCAQPDGIHFSAGTGYGEWVNYLRKHTVYRADTPWTPGTAFYLDPEEQADTAKDTAQDEPADSAASQDTTDDAAQA